MSVYFNGNNFQRDSFGEFVDALQHKSFFTKIKETLTRKPALPETLPTKIEKAKELCKIELRRDTATGKKMENLETQGLDEAVDKSRVEVNNGEMAKVFDKYAKEANKEASKNGESFEIDIPETDIAKKIKIQLTEEYMSVLGKEKKDLAQLVANAEYENYSGAELYVPYPRKIFCRLL